MAILTAEQVVQTEPQSPQATLRAIPDGVGGIRATLDEMVSLTRQYRVNLMLRNLAEQIVVAVPGKSYFGEAAAIQQWVRDNIRYTGDIADVETLKTPDQLIVSRFGDCDDMSLLSGTLLQTLNHPVRYVAVGREPGNFEHVFPETKIGNRWVAVETTEEVPLGWVPPDMPFRMVRHV
jgi:transglutaminase-like putative cysteine protease